MTITEFALFKNEILKIPISIDPVQKNEASKLSNQQLFSNVRSMCK